MVRRMNRRRRLRRHPRRRQRAMRVPRNLYSQNRVYHFKRSLDMTSSSALTVDGFVVSKGSGSSSGQLRITGPSTGGQTVYGALSYYGRLNDVPDAIEFASLWDQYRINGIRIEFIPYNNASYTSQGGEGADMGVLVHDVVDYDDAAIPTASAVGVGSLMEYHNYKRRSVFRNGGGQSITRYWKPNASMSLYNGPVTTGYGPVRTPWIDAASPDVQHYAWKCIPEVYSSGSTGVLVGKLIATYYISVRNVR